MAASRPMKQVLLMRHAHALAPVVGQLDFDRALSPTGLREAHEAGRWLHMQGIVPERVLCSPALRTRQTLATASQAAAMAVATEFESEIYDAEPDTLLALLQDASADADTLWLVGHNPGISQLLNELRPADAPWRDMATASCAWLRWVGPLIGRASEMHFWSP